MPRLRLVASLAAVAAVLGLLSCDAKDDAPTLTPGDLVHWERMKLPGQPTLVDGKPAPWGDSHRLTSARKGAGHGSMSDMSSSGYPSVWKTIFTTLEP